MTDEGYLQAHIVGGHWQGWREGTRAAQAPGTQEAPGSRLGAPAVNRTRRAETDVSASCPSGDVRRPGGQQT